MAIANPLEKFLSSGHLVFIVLPTPSDVSSGHSQFDDLPCSTIELKCVKGSTLKFVVSDPFFTKYAECLRDHEIVMASWKTNPPKWGELRPIIVDNINRPVCAKLGNIFLLHPPSPGREALAFAAIVDFFKPDLDEPALQPKPDWAESAEADIPGVREATSRIVELQKQIESLHAQMMKAIESKADIEKWADMLWLDGIALQRRVCDALRFLGITAIPRNETGHNEDLVATHLGHKFLIEVTGSTGCIGIEKGRQLMHWVNEEPDPSAVKGVLIANPYRREPPNHRPPSPNHKLFVTELENMAQKFDFALIEVSELFRVVISKLAKNSIDPKVICDGLLARGSVRFSIP